MHLLRTAQFTLFNLLLASSTAHASPEINLTEGVTPVSHDIYHLHMTTFWVCVAIAAVVFGVMIYSLIYHRKSVGAKAAHFHENFWLEIAWTIIPILILVSLAIPATRVLIHMHDDTLPDLTIKVTGSQWKWHYDYLDQDLHFFSNLSTPYDQIHGNAKKDEYYLREVNHPLVVPIHKKIRFLITSNDVIHGWWVPDLGVKHDAIPGFIYEEWARVNKPGTYRGQCSKLCGLNHGYMPIVVIAVTQKDFDDWVAQQKNGGEPVMPVTTTQTTTATAAVTTTTSAKTATTAAATTTSAKTSTTAAATTTSAKTATTAATTTTSAKPTTAAPTTSETKLTKDELMQIGQQVFLGTCAACHKPDGTGSPPVFPALKGSKTATGPVGPHIDTVLNGRKGTAMQAFKDQFSSKELAGVITYERNSFGNHTGDLVQPAEIDAAKAKSK